MRASALLPVLLPVVLGLSGCLLGPDYVRPTVDTPATYRFNAGEATEVANAAWWEQFQDPVLNDLIAVALAENKDVKIAAARVDQFLGQFVTTRAGLFPQLDAGFDAQRQRVSQAGPVPLPAGVSPVYNTFQPALSAAWEIDVFGKVRRETESARASLLASEEGRRATIPQLEVQIAQQEDALSVLLGRNPGDILRGRELSDLAIPSVPAGLPSDLLERRPDVVQAEQNLVAANALIGAARALYFPSISLTGLFGSASGEFSKLFTGPAKIWAFAGSVSMPIFTAGSISGQVKQAEAQQQQALFQYEETIQTAFQEVDDALIALQKSREQLVVLGREVDSLKTYARLARLRFEGGYTSYIEVLDAERSLFNAQLSYTQTNGVVYESVVALYKAMGGGWVVTAEQMTHKDKNAPQPTGQPGEQHSGIAANAEQSVAELPR